MVKKYLVLGGLLLGLSAPALALNATPLSNSFSQPLFLNAPSGDSRLFVVEKGGSIKVMQGNTVSIYLDISARVDTDGERGLLGLAFDPAFASNGRFYVDYVDITTHNTVVAAFTAPSAASNTANPNSGQPIITVQQFADRTNHKGGWSGFRGTDPGQLYIATGDGGSANDPNNVAQDVNNNLGKILRITLTAGGGYTVPASNPFVGRAGNE